MDSGTQIKVDTEVEDSKAYTAHIDFDMDDDVDTLSVADPNNELLIMDRQRASLQIYLDSLPYECESVDEMQAKLEEIVEKIVICAHTRSWHTLSTWDGVLQCWLLMRYPIATSTRAKLARLYYELCLLPGLDSRVIRSWADMFTRVVSTKPGLTRKLEASDLELSWQPLWRVLQKELWPKGRLHNDTRNMINVLLYVAEQSKRYYPAREISNMLNTFLPILTNNSYLMMIPIMASFLPPRQTHLYLPSIFKLWEAYNSARVDDRLIELAGDLSEEHVAAKFGIAGADGAEWRDVGIWSEDEWTLLVRKGLGSLNVALGGSKGSVSTASYADSRGFRSSLRIKKSTLKYHAIAKIFVYSMAVDGPIRDDALQPQKSRDNSLPTQQNGYLAGSRALDSLDRLITCTESFFHPSNSGPWTLNLSTFLLRLVSEFGKRWMEEQEPSCKTPAANRLTPVIRREFVTILSTPAFLAMFSKDHSALGNTQNALRTMALLEPTIIMPELLERAYGGLESVNETHRTTAVLNMLSGIARPLVSEKVWLGGQKHLVPLLELCIPGIDLNDPIKTVHATSFIVGAVQHVRIGDLSGFTTSGSLGTEMDIHSDGNEEVCTLRDDERALARESTSGFADWVVSLIRRVLALYENLPEEGGQKNTTGGKQEEDVLKSIKNMMDVLCMHLSEQLFDLVLSLVFNYATTNAKSNAVRAIGQLVSSLARVNPERTVAKFLPFCIPQIEDELAHGASSVRTTSTHAAIPSDTTLHWNLSILRGCLGYGGPALLKYKDQIIGLLAILVDKTKGERGYTGTGSLIKRVLHTLSGVYPLSGRFINTKEWENPEFDKGHNTQWGRLYEAQDVEVEWHVPSSDEIAFVLEILDRVAKPALNKVESLLETTASWDSVARNDFCRFLHACKSVWIGLPTLYQEHEKDVKNPCLNEDTEMQELSVSTLRMKAGFTLTDPNDHRYQLVSGHRIRFGNILRDAASALRHNSEGEDHIDAVIVVTKAIDAYLLDHGGMTRSSFDAVQKNYARARELNRMWSRQKVNTRGVFVMRAQAYHSGRIYLNALYRRRSELDDGLIKELVELSLSPYTRVRRYAQSTLNSVCRYYDRSTKLILPTLLDALGKGNDADRMKGALYVLWNKGTAAYAFADEEFYCRYLLSLLECQHEEKPSVQKLVNALANDCLTYLSEEAHHTHVYSLETPRVNDAIGDLAAEFTPNFVSKRLLAQAHAKSLVQVQKRRVTHNKTISLILEVASRPTTHWRYVRMAARFLHNQLRRDVPTSPDLASFFMENSISDQPTIRVDAQRAVSKLLAFVKIRTYAKTGEELWFDEWRNPLARYLPVSNHLEFLESLHRPVRAGTDDVYVDKIDTGFISWTDDIKCYGVVQQASEISWEPASQATLDDMSKIIKNDNYFRKMSLLWSQESTRSSGKVDFRWDDIAFIKSLAKMFGAQALDDLLTVLDELLSDSDKFKQRASLEFLAGVLRGSKHWPRPLVDKVWQWTSSRLDRIFAQINPDTLPFWVSFLTYVLANWDSRRNQPLVDWIFALPFEFNGNSAFAMNKALTMFTILEFSLGVRFKPLSSKYMNLFLDAANTGYAEMRSNIAQAIHGIIVHQWRPSYPSTDAFLLACKEVADPLGIRDMPYVDRVAGIVKQLQGWKEQRLPPPRVNQSEYDKVGMTMLVWIWAGAYGGQASLIFPCVALMLPEVLRMSELNDDTDLQMFSAAVLYMPSCVTPPEGYVDVIIGIFVNGIKSSASWRIRLNALPGLMMFFYNNLIAVSPSGVSQVMDVLLECLADENVEVRERASKMLSGIVRSSQRQSITPLKNRFLSLARKVKLPERQDPSYADSLRTLHSAILGLCALIESFPYSVEPWMPSLTEVLALHATDPPPISTTIRKCASEFKKTHQDTWHKDQHAFDEDQLQSLSTMLVGTSYYA